MTPEIMSNPVNLYRPTGPPPGFGPYSPRRWTEAYKQSVVSRWNKRVNNIPDRLAGVVRGRSDPDPGRIPFGGGRQFEAAVLFLDICGFSTWPSSTTPEQLNILAVLYPFMSEMLAVVHDFDGFFEKNTGDGLMAYF